MIQEVHLTPADSILTAKFKAGGIVFVLCDATNGEFTVTLPTSHIQPATLFIFIKTDSSANAVTISPYSTDTINGATSASLATQYSVKRILNDIKNLTYNEV